jgi:hypothetical protein
MVAVQDVFDRFREEYGTLSFGNFTFFLLYVRDDG